MSVQTIIEDLVIKFSVDLKQYTEGLLQAEKSFNYIVHRIQFMASNLGAHFLGSMIRTATGFEDAMNSTMFAMEGGTDGIRRSMEQVAMTLSGSSLTAPTELAQAYFEMSRAGMSALHSTEALSVVERFAVANRLNMVDATRDLVGMQRSFNTFSNDAVENANNLRYMGDVITAVALRARVPQADFFHAIQSMSPALGNMNRGLEESVALLATLTSSNMSAHQASSATIALMRDFQHLSEHANNPMRPGRLGGLTPGQQMGNHHPQVRFGIHPLHGMNADVQGTARSWNTLGISLRGADNQMRPMVELIQEMSTRFGGLGDTELRARLGMAGFSESSMQTLSILIRNNEALEEFVRIGLNADGMMTNLYDSTMRSFSSQMTVLRNNVHVLGIEVGRVLVPYLLYLNQIVLSGFTTWNSYNDATKQTIVNVVMFVAGLLVLRILLPTILGVLAKLALATMVFATTLFSIVATPILVFFRALQASIYLVRVAIAVVSISIALLQATSYTAALATLFLTYGVNLLTVSTLALSLVWYVLYGALVLSAYALLGILFAGYALGYAIGYLLVGTGLLGASWRILSAIAIFAAYAIGFMAKATWLAATIAWRSGDILMASWIILKGFLVVLGTTYGAIAVSIFGLTNALAINKFIVDASVASYRYLVTTISSLIAGTKIAIASMWLFVGGLRTAVVSSTLLRVAFNNIYQGFGLIAEGATGSLKFLMTFFQMFLRLDQVAFLRKSYMPIFWGMTRQLLKLGDALGLMVQGFSQVFVGVTQLLGPFGTLVTYMLMFVGMGFYGMIVGITSAIGYMRMGFTALKAVVLGWVTTVRAAIAAKWALLASFYSGGIIVGTMATALWIYRGVVAGLGAAYTWITSLTTFWSTTLFILKIAVASAAGASLLFMLFLIGLKTILILVAAGAALYFLAANASAVGSALAAIGTALWAAASWVLTAAVTTLLFVLGNVLVVVAGVILVMLAFVGVIGLLVWALNGVGDLNTMTADDWSYTWTRVGTFFTEIFWTMIGLFYNFQQNAQATITWLAANWRLMVVDMGNIFETMLRNASTNFGEWFVSGIATDLQRLGQALNMLDVADRIIPNYSNALANLPQMQTRPLYFNYEVPEDVRESIRNAGRNLLNMGRNGGEDAAAHAGKPGDTFKEMSLRRFVLDTGIEGAGREVITTNAPETNNRLDRIIALLGLNGRPGQQGLGR